MPKISTPCPLSFLTHWPAAWSVVDTAVVDALPVVCLLTEDCFLNICPVDPLHFRPCLGCAAFESIGLDYTHFMTPEEGDIIFIIHFSVGVRFGSWSLRVF